MTESEIIAAVTALGIFQKVRYLVAEADPDSVPTVLPIFVLDGASRDFNTNRTFCGTALVMVDYTAVILADTAASARSLADQVIAALSTEVNFAGCVDAFDADDGFYSSTLTFSTTS